ncbi:transporter [Xanthomonas citri pv. durantae]|uniref:Transporter n=4 Tax=Xanthomonas citri TaxID=346 RepID=A0A9X9N9I7_XANCI|nr:transporter [Xanthomonas citri pv. durantae]
MNLYACVQGRAGCRLAIGAVAIASILPVPSKATENGQVHYPIGVNTIMNAALPAPGETGFYLYTQYYESTRLNDGKGRSVDPNFKANVYAVVPRIVHSWNQRIGPFWLSSGAIVPLTRVDLRAGGHRDVSTGVIPPLLAVARSGAKRPSPTSWQA